MDFKISRFAAEGLDVLLLGMAITISSLIILTFIVIWSKKFADRVHAGHIDSGDARNPGGDMIFQPQTKDKTGELMLNDERKADAANPSENELIAVFIAAIIQATGGAVSTPRIVSFRKTGQNAPVWNLRGRNEYLSGKL